MLVCRYFDGRSSRAHAATAASCDPAGSSLHIVADGIDRVVEASEMRFAPATGRGPARIAFASGGLCEFDDHAAAEALFTQLGYRKSHADRLSSRTSHAVMIALAFVVVLAVLYRWGIPWAADEIVVHAPRKWDEALGDGVLKTLDDRHVFRPTGLSQEHRDRIVKRFDALKLPLDSSHRVIEFRRLGVPNALALPGNIIVVTDEIVVTAPDDDALMTVLAHEVGHIDHRDAMRQLVRSAMSSMIAAWYIGDVSNAVAVVAGGFGTLTYSRDAEHRADLYAVDAMKANGISTKSAAELFRRLEAWAPPRVEKAKHGDKAERADEADGDSSKTAPPSKPPEVSSDADKSAKNADRKPESAKRFRFEILEYLSTHPATEDRIKLFENDGAAAPS
jgi:Zn-dependent protease with chaperone function